MSENKSNTAVATKSTVRVPDDTPLAQRPVLDLAPVIITDPLDPRAIPNNKLVASYFEEGYELLEFRTRNRDEAKDRAKELRSEGKLTAYITLLGGWFGVFAKDAPARESKSHSAPKRPDVPVTFEGKTFASTREARAYARLLIEAAKQAEFEYDVEQAKLRKHQQDLTRDREAEVGKILKEMGN